MLYLEILDKIYLDKIYLDKVPLALRTTILINGNFLDRRLVTPPGKKGRESCHV